MFQATRAEEFPDIRIAAKPVMKMKRFARDGRSFLLERKLVAAQTRHHDVADYASIFMNLHFEERFLPVERHVDKIVFVPQNPLQS